MTLGLAYGDKSAIYGAIDSFGTSGDGMRSKIVVFPSNLMLLTAGGMIHWRDAINKYEPQGPLGAAATALAERLDRYMNQANQAFGLLCGYEDGEPVCYRLNRAVNDNETSVLREDFDEVRPIGGPQGVNAIQIARQATDAIRSGRNPRTILEDTISECVRRSSEVTKPIVVRSVRQ